MTTDQRLHVAIIPDGNRRWAKAAGLLPWQGHSRAVENFTSLVEWAAKDGRIAALTIWCFSTENWKRDEREVNELMKLLASYLEREGPALKKNRIHLVHSGRRDRLSEEMIALIDRVSSETKDDPTMTLNLAIDYGGKDEVLRALKRMGPQTMITEEQVRSFLDHPELRDIDLIIRTSGEQRTSNFALWQSTYAEWMFSLKLFPEFLKEDLADAVETFSKRNRRFGA